MACLQTTEEDTQKLQRGSVRSSGLGDVVEVATYALSGVEQQPGLLPTKTSSIPWVTTAMVPRHCHRSLRRQRRCFRDVAGSPFHLDCPRHLTYIIKVS